MLEISILMPVYNSEKYLHSAIDSVLKQTFVDWELLCIDDGSVDNSLIILRSYSEKDTRIKCLTQKNCGPMAARRFGFEHSSGHYIIYLDSDDCYSPEVLEYLYDEAIKTNADAIAPDMIYVGEHTSFSWNEKFSINKSETLSGVDGFVETFPWRKLHNFNLWKRDVFKKSTYHPYLENNDFNADEILQRVLLLNCKKIVFSKAGAYIHKFNDKSITNQLQIKNFNRIDANDKLIQLGIDYSLSDDVMEKVYGFSLFCQLKDLMLSFYSQNNSLSKEERKWAMAKMKRAFIKYTSHPIGKFYGESPAAYFKQLIQIKNFALFRFLCYLQATLSKL